jgi:DNA mismatch repair protein MutH
MGLDLSPVTDRLDVVRALQELLSLPTAPSAGSVVSFDLAHVGMDLSAVPVNEVLVDSIGRRNVCLL